MTEIFNVATSLIQMGRKESNLNISALQDHPSITTHIETKVKTCASSINGKC